MALPGIGPSSGLSMEELHEIEECQKLVRLRDQILTGAHPRIKPAHLSSKPRGSEDSRASNALASGVNLPTGSTERSQLAVGNATAKNKAAGNQGSHATYGLPGSGGTVNNGPLADSSLRPFVPSGNAEFNPVLLEKSEDLKKAEMRLQRQRIERSFQDDLDKRRAGNKATLPVSDEVDLTDVLSRAQALVQPTVAQPTDELAANGSASGDDSFDDNTFYSSQHDTPEFLETEASRRDKSPEDVEMLDESEYEPELDNEPASLVTATQTVESNISKRLQANAALQEGPSSGPTSAATGPSSQKQHSSYVSAPFVNSGTLGPAIPPWIPGLQTSLTTQTLEAVSSQDSGAEASNSEEASSLDKGKRVVYDQQRFNEVNHMLSSDRQDLPAVLRGHNLSPIAPQPARVSPLAVVREPPAPQNEHIGRRATPPQVVALRQQASGASSPDSSPQTSRSGEKRKNKRKNKDGSKKAKGKKAAGRVPSPVIKAEPRSPSPMIAPEFTRPAKRQRNGQRPRDGQNREEGPYDHPPGAVHGRFGHYDVEETYTPRQQPPVVIDGSRIQQGSPSYHVRHADDYYEPRRVSAVQFPRPVSPGGGYTVQHVPGKTRSTRAVSHAVVDHPYQEASTSVHYYGGREPLRPAADRARSRSPVAYDRPMSVMPPPRAPVRRIIVDEYGREYIEPPRPIVTYRPSAVPEQTYDESEVIYERPLPARAVSRRPDVYEAEGSLYGQPSPAYVSAPYARRVVTQPELSRPDYRVYREREYSARPPARLVEGAVSSSSRVPVVGQAASDIQREFIPRAPSVRPEAEPYSYQVPEGYERRVIEGYEYVPLPARAGTVRPLEVPPYGGTSRRDEWDSRHQSVHPEHREYVPRPEPSREMPPPMAPPRVRAYSVHPMGAAPHSAAQQDYYQPAAPADGYYQRASARADDEVTYMGQTPRQQLYHLSEQGR